MVAKPTDDFGWRPFSVGNRGCCAIIFRCGPYASAINLRFGLLYSVKPEGVYVDPMSCSMFEVGNWAGQFKEPSGQQHRFHCREFAAVPGRSF